MQSPIIVRKDLFLNFLKSCWTFLYSYVYIFLSFFIQEILKYLSFIISKLFRYNLEFENLLTQVFAFTIKDDVFLSVSFQLLIISMNFQQLISYWGLRLFPYQLEIFQQIFCTIYDEIIELRHFSNYWTERFTSFFNWYFRISVWCLWVSDEKFIFRQRLSFQWKMKCAKFLHRLKSFSSESTYLQTIDTTR